MEIVTRKEAIARGWKRFLAKKPCKYGHAPTRLSKNGACETCYQNHKRQRRRKIRGQINAPGKPQPPQCECCKTPAVMLSRAMDEDHDHASGLFRGWLCNSCNTGIGKFNDSIEGLRKAVAYLERFENEKITLERNIAA